LQLGLNEWITDALLMGLDSDQIERYIKQHLKEMLEDR
jgi:hypothetical protein